MKAELQISKRSLQLSTVLRFLCSWANVTSSSFL